VCEFQIAWGLKNCVLVPHCTRYHIPNIIEYNCKMKKKIQGFAKKNPALCARASESGLLKQIFDSEAIIWGLFSIFKL
jgi:hypothetical protein